jgi:hypothetical protein
MLLYYGEYLLASRQTLKLKDNPLSAVRRYFLNIYSQISFKTAGRLHNPQPEDTSCDDAIGRN